MMNNSSICSPRSQSNIIEIFHSTKDKSWSIGDFLKTKTIIEVNHEEKIVEGIINYTNNHENEFISFKRKRTENNSDYMFSNNSQHSNKKHTSKIYDVIETCRV